MSAILPETILASREPYRNLALLWFPKALEMSSADEADLAKQLQAQREEDMLPGLKKTIQHNISIE